MFLHSLLTYLQLVPEAFITDGCVSEEKLVRFAMSFMANNAATCWAKRRSSAIPFPFPTWAGFEAEFCLRFVEENEQDQALAKPESHSYFRAPAMSTSKQMILRSWLQQPDTRTCLSKSPSTAQASTHRSMS
jgi:hypothetical protein